MVLFDIHQRVKGHFLNELRVSFKNVFWIICFEYWAMFTAEHLMIEFEIEHWLTVITIYFVAIKDYQNHVNMRVITKEGSLNIYLYKSLQSWAKYCRQIHEINCKIGFSMECFTADFLQFSSTIVKICFFGGRHGTCHQFQAFRGSS